MGAAERPHAVQTHRTPRAREHRAAEGAPPPRPECRSASGGATWPALWAGRAPRKRAPPRGVGVVTVETRGPRSASRRVPLSWALFFFKQKTAYEMPK